MASRLCWNCETEANQTPVLDPVRTKGKTTWLMAFSCDGCRALSIAAMKLSPSLPPHYIDRVMLQQSDQLIWYPSEAFGKDYNKKHRDVPYLVADAASEAWGCYSVRQYRASALMARSVVEAIAKDQGQTSGSLEKKIDALYANEVIGKSLKEDAHEIRFVGNEMAHGDFIMSTIGEAECLGVLHFLDGIIDEVYVRPAARERHRTVRDRRKQNPPVAR